MNVTFLGTGTSFGVPMIGCPCTVCLSNSPYNKRLRSSLLIHDNNTTILLDTTPDFRTQALNIHLSYLTGVVYTHYHFDHIAGLDDLRAFRCSQNKGIGPIKLYADDRTRAVIQQRFSYCFNGHESSYNIPHVTLNTMVHFAPFTVGNIEILPLPVYHGEDVITGFIFNRLFAYFSDISFMPEETRQYLKNIPFLVLTALRLRPHKKHYSLPQAMATAESLNASRTYFTHISHMIDHEKVSASLPPSMNLAYDGLQISC